VGIFVKKNSILDKRKHVIDVIQIVCAELNAPISPFEHRKYPIRQIIMLLNLFLAVYSAHNEKELCQSYSKNLAKNNERK
jgi:hypothetical protein